MPRLFRTPSVAARLGALVSLTALALPIGGVSCGARTELSVDPFAVDASTPTDAPISGARCGPANCSGCCDAMGICQPGSSMQACGAHGLVCASCPTKTICEPQVPVGQLVCVNPCDRGCSARCCLPMSPYVCVAGDDNHACGSDSLLCDDCAAMGQMCTVLSTGLHGCR